MSVNETDTTRESEDWPTRSGIKNEFTYMDFDYRVRTMIYTTNWIEWLNKSFRRVMKMRYESVNI